MSITAKTENIDITSSNSVEISSNVINAEVITRSTATAEITPNTFVVSSGGMYAGQLDGALPAWLSTAIQEGIVNGTVNINSLVSDLTT